MSFGPKVRHDAERAEDSVVCEVRGETGRGEEGSRTGVGLECDPKRPSNGLTGLQANERTSDGHVRPGQAG
jgi:hypothetical protein